MGEVEEVERFQRRKALHWCGFFSTVEIVSREEASVKVFGTSGDS